jgi:hypothetical protein
MGGQAAPFASGIKMNFSLFLLLRQNIAGIILIKSPTLILTTRYALMTVAQRLQLQFCLVQ